MKALFSKENGINAIRIGAFLLLLLLVLSCTYRVLSWKDTAGDYLSCREMLDATPGDTVDVFFAGTSHVYCGIYPGVLWSEYGIASFDLAVSDQTKEETLAYLKNACKKQSPKVVVVDLFALTYDTHSEPGNLYRNLANLPFGPEYVKLLGQEVSKEAFPEYLLKWPIVHERYAELGKYDFVSYPPSRFVKGELYSDLTESLDPASLQSIPAGELSDTNVAFLEGLLELSREEGFIPVLTVLPFSQTTEAGEQISAAYSYAENAGINVISAEDIMRLCALDPAADFRDGSHLNASGAEKVSHLFGEILATSFALTDHRGDLRYASWDRDLIYLEHQKLLSYLRQTEDAAQYLRCLSSHPDLQVIFSLEADYMERNNIYYEPLSAFGLTYEEYAAGGKWITQQGKAQLLHPNDPSAKPVTKKLEGGKLLQTAFHGDLSEQNLLLDGEDLSNQFYFLKVIVYDPLTGEILDSKGF
ncbi:MAG: hypothetical protein K5891_04000 [Lachnospiraceae bacterium]|nr:hypothetical protein [Lachnospiraceae bacterium]